MEMERIMQVLDRGRIIKAETPSGRRQREVAKMAALIGKGRDASKKARRKRMFEEKMKTLEHVTVRRMKKEDVKKLREMAVFYRGSKEHKVKFPDVDVGKEKKRKLWNPVVGEKECGMTVIDKVAGFKVEGEDVWLVPRTESVEQLGEQRSLKWAYEMFSALEKSGGKNNVRQNPNGKRIAVMDGEGSKCNIVGTQVRLFGRGLVSNMTALEGKGKKIRMTFEKYIGTVERLMRRWLDPLSQDTMKAVKNSNEKTGMQLGRGRRSELWSSVAFGKNVSLCLHRDDDFSVGMVQVIGEEGEDGMEEGILAYFCFPTLSACVALRSGDTLVFNAHLDHCITSRVNGRKNLYCVSFYMNYQIPSSKDNRTGSKDE